MTEMVIAVFDATSAADAAVQDLEVARIPSAVIRREVPDNPELRDDSTRHGAQIRGRPVMTVAVDDIHAELVTGILDQYAPLDIQERAV
jgi:hypothetical protein